MGEQNGIFPFLSSRIQRIVDSSETSGCKRAGIKQEGIFDSRTWLWACRKRELKLCKIYRRLEASYWALSQLHSLWLYFCKYLVLVQSIFPEPSFLIFSHLLISLQMALPWVSSPGLPLWWWWPFPSQDSSPSSSSCWPVCAARKGALASR